MAALNGKAARDIRELARQIHCCCSNKKWTNSQSTYRDVADHVPLTLQNAKEWIDLIWKVLLVEIPNPEMDPRLRQLGDFPSRRQKSMNFFGKVGAKTQASNVRATIKAKLGLYLERMLNDQAVHK